MEIFSKRLRELREEMNLVQKELAFALGISQRMLSHYERNESEPNAELLLKISNFFNVSIDYLLGKTDI